MQTPNINFELLWTKAWDLHPAFAPLTHLLFIFFPSNIQLSKSPKSNRILNFRIFCAFIATQKHIKHIHHSPLVIYQYLHILHKFFGHYFIVHNVWKTSPVMGPWWVWTMQRFCHLFYLRSSKCATWVFFHLVMFFI